MLSKTSKAVVVAIVAVGLLVGTLFFAPLKPVHDEVTVTGRLTEQDGQIVLEKGSCKVTNTTRYVPFLSLSSLQEGHPSVRGQRYLGVRVTGWEADREGLAYAAGTTLRLHTLSFQYTYDTETIYDERYEDNTPLEVFYYSDYHGAPPENISKWTFLEEITVNDGQAGLNYQFDNAGYYIIRPKDNTPSRHDIGMWDQSRQYSLDLGYCYLPVAILPPEERDVARVTAEVQDRQNVQRIIGVKEYENPSSFSFSFQPREDDWLVEITVSYNGLEVSHYTYDIDSGWERYELV